MQLAMTVGSVVLAGIVVVALIGSLFEKYAGNLEQDETQRVDRAGSDVDRAGSKDRSYIASKR